MKTINQFLHVFLMLLFFTPTIICMDHAQIQREQLLKNSNLHATPEANSCQNSSEYLEDVPLSDSSRANSISSNANASESKPNNIKSRSHSTDSQTSKSSKLSFFSCLICCCKKTN